MFESAFESLGHISERHSGKLIIAWIAIILLLAPFAGMLFGMTSYDISSGIVPSNSMAVRADNLLSEYFPGSAASANSSNSMIVVTTGTNINDASVISSYISAQSLASRYLSGQGITSNITSVVGLEKTTLAGFSSGALEEMNATYGVSAQLAAQMYQLNTTLNSTLQMIYGIPAIFLFELGQTGSPYSAYMLTQQMLGSSPVPSAYLGSFYFYFNNSGITNATQNAVASIDQAVTNTSSQYYTIASANPPLKAISYSILGNFTLADFSLATQSQRLHYYGYAYAYSFSSFVPGLYSNQSIRNFIVDQLNTTVPSFFGRLYNISQPASQQQLTQTAVALTAHGLSAALEFNPLLKVNSIALVSYLEQLGSGGNLTAFVNRVMQFSGFNGYPVIPSPYVMRNFVGLDNSTTIMAISLSANLTDAQTNDLESAIAAGFSTVGGHHLYVSGSNVMSSQLASQTIGGMIRALIIGIVLSILIVGIFFRSIVAAFLPLAMFGVSAASAFSLNALLYKYVLKSSISFITPTLLLILLLGLSTDYVVYIMARFRTELRKGNPNPVVVSSKWAGHAVFTSGLTVSMSYVALWISNVPIFSDSGITNAIGVLLAVIVANTLLVSILHRGGKKIFWPSKIVVSEGKARAGPMERLSEAVIKNKGKLIMVFLVLGLLSTYYYYSTPTNMDVFSLLPSGSGVTAINVVNQSYHGDYFDQAYVILQFNSPVLTSSGYNTTIMGEINSVEKTLITNEHVSAIAGPTYPYGYFIPYNLSGIPSSQQATYRSQMNQYIGTDSRYVLITFQLSALAWTSYSSNFVKALPSMLTQNDGGSFKTFVGGLTEGLNDAYSFTEASFTNMIPVLVVAIFAVLAIQISALFTPIRLVLMVLASVIIALAITYLILHEVYHLSLLIFLPMFTIITLLAVGLDYDIFMVSRVREEVMKGRTDQEGIKTSLIENGGVIITLGAVLFATFASLLFSGIGLIEEIGFGLALGVLIDTFVSWPLFVPAVMLFLRRYNWWPSKLGESKDKEKVPSER